MLYGKNVWYMNFALCVMSAIYNTYLFRNRQTSQIEFKKRKKKNIYNNKF